MARPNNSTGRNLRPAPTRDRELSRARSNRTSVARDVRQTRRNDYDVTHAWATMMNNRMRPRPRALDEWDRRAAVLASPKQKVVPGYGHITIHEGEGGVPTLLPLDGQKYPPILDNGEYVGRRIVIPADVLPGGAKAAGGHEAVAVVVAYAAEALRYLVWVEALKTTLSFVKDDVMRYVTVSLLLPVPRPPSCFCFCFCCCCYCYLCSAPAPLLHHHYYH